MHKLQFEEEKNSDQLDVLVKACASREAVVAKGIRTVKERHNLQE